MANFSIEGRSHVSPLYNYLWEFYIVNARSLYPKLKEDELSVACKSVPLPGSEIVTYTTHYMGVKKEIPIKKNLTQNITVDFELYEDGEVYNFFYNWTNLMFEQDPSKFSVGNTVLTMPSNMLYMRSIVIKQYKYNLEELNRYYVLHHAYPKKISDMNLTYVGGTEIMKMSVDFNFSHWTLENK